MKYENAFSQEQAAKYLILAWLKDWKFITYAKTISGTTKGLVDLGLLHSVFKFMPEIRYPNYVRVFVASNMPMLNEKLWNNRENTAYCMSLWKEVLKYKIKEHCRKSDKNKPKKNSANKDFHANCVSYALYKDYGDRCGGHNWKVVK